MSGVALFTPQTGTMQPQPCGTKEVHSALASQAAAIGAKWHPQLASELPSSGDDASKSEPPLEPEAPPPSPDAGWIVPPQPRASTRSKVER